MQTMKRIGVMLAAVGMLAGAAQGQSQSQSQNQDQNAPESEPSTVSPAGSWALVLGPFPARSARLQLDATTNANGAVTWTGTWSSQGEQSALSEITWDAASATLRFRCAAQDTVFESTVQNEQLKGTWANEDSTWIVRGERVRVTPADLVGYWTVESEFAGRTRETLLSITLVNGTLRATTYSEMGETEATDVTLAGDTLRFSMSLGGGMDLSFSATIDGDTMAGAYEASFGTISLKGSRLEL